MKKIISVALMFCILTMFLALTACGGEDAAPKNPSVADVMATMKKDIELPEMTDVDKETFGVIYPIAVDEIEDIAYIAAGSGITSDEILILKMKDGTDMTALKDKLVIHQKAQAELFSTYAPDEAPKIDKAAIVVNGNYALLAITSDNKAAEKIFTAAM